MTRYLILDLSKPAQEGYVEELLITPENQNSLLQQDYQEHLLIDVAFASKLTKHPLTKAAIAQENFVLFDTLQKKHHQTTSAVVIQKTASSGLAAFLASNKILSKDSSCFIYSGLYTEALPAYIQQSDKSLQINFEKEKVLLVGEGQVAGYIQHLPKENSIPEDLLMLGSASENLIAQSMFVCFDKKTISALDENICIPIRCLTPKTCFSAKTTPLLLGFDYGIPYWAARKCAPFFFDDYGEILKEQAYVFSLQSEKNFTLGYVSQRAIPALCQTHQLKTKDEENRFLIFTETRP